jgi:hypothetical protein
VDELEEGVCILRVLRNPPQRGAKQNAHMDKTNVVRLETQASVVAEGKSRVASKVLTPGRVGLGVMEKDVDSKRTTPALERKWR